MSSSVSSRLIALLESKGVSHQVLEHVPVSTSEEAAAVRGTPLGSGAKALVVKAGERFVLLVVPADLKLDSKKAQKALGGKGLRFATKDELWELTGLLPGAVPPFGSLFGLPTYLDPALAGHAEINFNAGSNAVSVRLGYEDYLGIEQPTLLRMT